MDKVHTLTLVLQCPADRGAYETLRPFYRDRLETNPRCVGEAHLGIFLRKGFLEQLLEFFVLVRPVLELDACIDILGVLAEDDHIYKFRMPHRGRHTAIVAYRAQTDVQIEQLAQGNVQRTNAASDRSRERTLDPHQEFPECLGRLVWQPALEHLERFLPRVYFHPVDFALAAIGFLHRCVEHAHRRAPDIPPRAIAFYKGDNRMIGNVQRSIFDGNLFPALGDLDICISHECLLENCAQEL